MMVWIFLPNVNAFVSEAVGVKFKSRAGQIGLSVDDGSPLLRLRHLFELSALSGAQQGLC